MALDEKRPPKGRRNTAISSARIAACGPVNLRETLLTNISITCHSIGQREREREREAEWL